MPTWAVPLQIEPEVVIETKLDHDWDEDKSRQEELPKSKRLLPSHSPDR